MLPRYTPIFLSWCTIILGVQSAVPQEVLLDVSQQKQEPLISNNPHLDANPEGRAHCQTLSGKFPGLVSFAGNFTYENEQKSYWSITQALARPACRLTPTNADETSQLLQYLNEHEIDIAIVSGGHSTIVGATNIDAGITLDLSALSTISINEDKSTVTFGPGTRWLDVYQTLDPHGLTVPGARAGSVGAGGYLLGGGISLLSAQRGWSCDNILSMDILLGNGSIITANKSHHQDLFTSMKGHGSNFGIATSFTMPLTPFDTLQSSVLSYQGEHFPSLAYRITEFVKDSHREPDTAIELSVIADQSGTYIQGFLMATKFGEIRESRVLKPLFDVPHGTGYVSDTTPARIAEVLDTSNPRGFRHSRCTLTIRNEPFTLLAILAAIEREFLRTDLPGGISYMPALLVQPIYRAQVGKNGEGKGNRNVLGLDGDEGEEDGEPLLLLSLESTYSLPQHDPLIPAHLTSIRLLLEQIAREHDTLHPFVYPNYAGEDQDIFATLDANRLEWLKGVQGRYDGDEYVKRHVRGAFKL